MAPERGISLVFFVFLLNGSNACFHSNGHQNISITTGSAFYQECQCTEDGYSINDLQWLNNNDQPIETLGPGTTANVYTEQTESLNLHIPSTTKSTSGTYKCVTHVNGVTYTQSYTVVAYEKLIFFQTPSDQHLVLGKTSPITCQPMSESTVIVSWQKEPDQEEPTDISNDERYTVEKDRLVIHNVTENDAGSYKCTARVIATNEEVDKYIAVKVYREPEIINIRSTSYSTDNITVVAGNNLTIECIADGLPHPEYHWNKTLNANATKTEITWHEEINAIVFDDIKPEDSGVYTCHAYNLAGSSSRSVAVDVMIRPYITEFTNITAIEGSTIQITCNATGKSEPKIFITYEGKDFDYDSNETILEDYEPMANMAYLVIDRTKEGVYVCNATNEVGSVETPMYLTVLHRPYFDNHEDTKRIWGWDGKTITLNCDQESNPPATITWRFQGNNILTEDEVEINRNLLITLSTMSDPSFTMTIDNETAYGVYECSAKNEYGEATKRITLVEGFKPGRVKNIYYEDLTATSITFHMEGPEHVDGPDVIGVTANYDEAKNYNITDIHINRTWALGRPFKLEKLKPNTTYYVQFAALNEVGPGTWSSLLEFITLEKSVPESPVWDEEPITLARNSHVLKWQAPDDNGEPIDYYTLRYCSEEDENSCKTKKITKAEATELELVDLEFNTTYFLELVAHNAEGDSAAANVSIVVPAPSSASPSIELSGGAIIGISIVIVILCLLLLDVLLLVWRRQGIIATCCIKKDNCKSKETALNTRDKKGLLTNGESEERPNPGHKEFQYNKNTGVVTGKHSAV